MPPGSKKRKALKKKKQQQQLEAIGATSNNTDLYGHDEHGSQDERDSDGNLSSPGSQGNEEFWSRDSSPSPLSGLGKLTVKEETENAEVTGGQGAKGEDFIAVGRGMDHEENGVDKPPNSFPETFTHNTRKAASQEENDGTSVLEISPAVESVKPVGSSVSKVVISDKNEQVESSTDSDKSDEKKEKRRIEEANADKITLSSAETSKDVKSVKESQVPECSEEKEEDKIGNSGQQKLKEQPTKQDLWSIDSSLYIKPLISLLE